MLFYIISVLNRSFWNDEIISLRQLRLLYFYLRIMHLVVQQGLNDDVPTDIMHCEPSTGDCWASYIYLQPAQTKINRKQLQERQ